MKVFRGFFNALPYALALWVLIGFAVHAWADEAKSITLTATPEEIQALDQLIDAGIRAQGLAVAENGVYWHKKLLAAVSDANKPIPTLEPKP